MSKYTPGPWRLERIENDSGYIVHLCPVDGETQSILTVVEYESVKFAAVYKDADAFLIAAAPDLLEALKSLHERYVAAIGNEGPEALAARIAITKATTPKVQRLPADDTEGAA